MYNNLSSYATNSPYYDIVSVDINGEDHTRYCLGVKPASKPVGVLLPCSNPSVSWVTFTPCNWSIRALRYGGNTGRDITQNNKP